MTLVFLAIVLLMVAALIKGRMANRKRRAQKLVDDEIAKQAEERLRIVEKACREMILSSADDYLRRESDESHDQAISWQLLSKWQRQHKVGGEGIRFLGALTPEGFAAALEEIQAMLVKALDRRRELLSKMMLPPSDPMPEFLSVLAARYVLGMATSESLIDGANQALNEDLFSSALGELSQIPIRSRPSIHDTGPLFEKAVTELGGVLPMSDEAAWLLAYKFARGIVDRTIPPRDGVAFLGNSAGIGSPSESDLIAGDRYDLHRFFSLNDTYIDIEAGELRPKKPVPEALSELDAEIVREAQRWLDFHVSTCAR